MKIKLKLQINTGMNYLVNFEKEGERYPKLRSVFWSGMSEYYGASRNIPKFIGGIYHSRHHIGQRTDVLPLTVVDADDQRRALNFLVKKYIRVQMLFLLNLIF